MQTTEKFGDVAVVAIHLDQMDASTADDLKQELAPVLNENAKIVLISSASAIWTVAVAA